MFAFVCARVGVCVAGEGFWWCQVYRSRPASATHFVGRDRFRRGSHVLLTERPPTDSAAHQTAKVHAAQRLSPLKGSWALFKSGSSMFRTEHSEHRGMLVRSSARRQTPRIFKEVLVGLDYKILIRLPAFFKVLVGLNCKILIRLPAFLKFS